MVKSDDYKKLRLEDIPLEEDEDVLYDFNDYLLNNGLSKKEAKVFVEEIRNICNEFDILPSDLFNIKSGTSIGDLIGMYSHNCKEEENVKRDNIPLTALNQFWSFMNNKLLVSKKLYICVQKNYSSFGGHRKKLVKIEINDKVCSLTYSCDDRGLIKFTYKISNVDFERLLNVFTRYKNELCTDHTPSYVKFPYGCTSSYSFEFDGVGNFNCAHLFESKDYKVAEQAYIEYNEAIDAIINRFGDKNMQLEFKIKNKVNILTLPDDLNDFFNKSEFKDLRNRLIEKYKNSEAEVDYYTNSVQPGNEIIFDEPIKFLRPLMEEFNFNELYIKSVDGLTAGCLANLPITKITVEKTVKDIPAGLFADIKGLEEVVLSEGLETIGDEAFVGCKKLKEIFIPLTVSKIGTNVFGNCAFLNSIEVDNRNKKYSSMNSNIIVDLENMEVVQGCSASKLPEGVKSIGHKAFWKFPTLKEINLPKSLESIADDAFVGCVSLSKVSN